MIKKIIGLLLVVFLLVSACSAKPLGDNTQTDVPETVESPQVPPISKTPESPQAPPVVATPSEPETVSQPVRLDPWTPDDLWSYKQPVLYPDRTALEQTLNPNQDMDYIIQTAQNYPDFNWGSDHFLVEEFLAKGALPLSNQELLEDIDYFTDLLNKAFGGIVQFGGEKRVAEFNRRIKDQLGESGLTHQEFYELLSLEASFIEDGHFWINQTTPAETASYFSLSERWFKNYPYEDYRLYSPLLSTNLFLTKTSGGSYQEVSTGRQVVLKDIEPFIQPIMTGDTVYYSLILADNFSRPYLPAEVHFSDNTSLELEWREISSISQDMDFVTKTAPGEAVVEGDIFYLNLTGHIFWQEDPLNFPELGLRARQAKYLILDLRGNRGGHDSGGNTFLDSFFYDQSTHYFEQSYYTATPQKESDLASVRTTSPESLMGRHSLIAPEMVSYPERQPKIILLIDRATASSGEFFIGRLRASSQVPVLGQNTSGLATSGIGQLYRLPHSGISLRIPLELVYWSPDYYNPSRGFWPDIWLEETFSVTDLIERLNE